MPARAIPGETDLATLFPRIAAEWHPTLNGEHTPAEFTKGSNTHAWWQCPAHNHAYRATIKKRAIGQGCPICAGKRVLAGHNDLATHQPEIAHEWHPTKNALRPTEVTPASGSLVWWQCAEGHEWETAIRNRTAQGSGCPVCSGTRFLAGHNDFATTHPQLAREWNPQRNSITPNAIRATSQVAAWWICRKGHEYRMTVRVRVYSGSSCTVCKDHELREFPITLQYPHLSAEWDHLRNQRPLDSYAIHSRAKVWWKCSRGHDWEMAIGDRTARGRRCPTCDVKSATPLPRRLISVSETGFVHEWSPRNPQPASNYSHKSNVRAWWVCALGHEWLAKICHRHVAGCPTCSGKRILSGFNDLATTHPDIACQWHAQKNVLQPTSIGFGSTKKIWWMCDEGHAWIDTPNSRTCKGTRCPYCQGQRVLVGYNDLLTVRPDLAAQWHPNRNTFAPDEVTCGSNRHIWWQCEKGHEWRTMVVKRSSGTGCPECTLSQTSRREQAICSIIAKHFGVEYDGPHAVRGCRSKVDLAIPALTTAVEFDSWYWHRASLERDDRKTNALHAAGWTVVRIREAQGRHVLPRVAGILVEATVADSSKSVAGRAIAAIIRSQA
ncbi:zinc-ribbon domain-containing protein [Rhodococcus opacus]|uniref:zinc-ribbon domain-containing protein n=1 Tax=Rhodococcus opacus TaxID=37919 RepID=UPI001C46FC4F|nr:zinc-ribbon domain-containing protein [Rhodococcus opacus]MBV6762642.1 hypothetical protein [Rhodococcus opacus]